MRDVVYSHGGTHWKRVVRITSKTSVDFQFNTRRKDRPQGLFRKNTDSSKNNTLNNIVLGDISQVYQKNSHSTSVPSLSSYHPPSQILQPFTPQQQLLATQQQLQLAQLQHAASQYAAPTFYFAPPYAPPTFQPHHLYSAPPQQHNERTPPTQNPQQPQPQAQLLVNIGGASASASANLEQVQETLQNTNQTHSNTNSEKSTWLGMVATVLVSVVVGVALPDSVHGVTNRLHKGRKDSETCQGYTRGRQDFRDAVTRTNKKSVFKRIPVQFPISGTRANNVYLGLERKSTFQKGLRDGYEGKQKTYQRRYPFVNPPRFSRLL